MGSNNRKIYAYIVCFFCLEKRGQIFHYQFYIRMIYVSNVILKDLTLLPCLWHGPLCSPSAYARAMWPYLP